MLFIFFRSVLCQLPTLWKVFLAPISTSQCWNQISHSIVFHPCHLSRGPCLIRKYTLLAHHPPVDIPSFLQWIQPPMPVSKVENILKGIWIQSHHLHLQWRFKLWAGKFAWGVEAKHCWALSTNFWIKNFFWHHLAMVCLITSSKLARQ